MPFMTIDISVLSQAKQDLLNTLGLDTDAKVKKFLIDHLKREVKAKTVYAARKAAEEQEVDL
jgi:hypothetical protein